MILENRQLEHTQNHFLEIVVLLGIFLPLEQVPVFWWVLGDGRVIAERRQLFDFIVPDGFFEHDVLVLTDLLDLTEDWGGLVFQELLPGGLVSGRCRRVQIVTALIANFIVVLERLSGFIKPLEKVHHVSESDINFKLVHELENVTGFDLTFND